MGALLKVYTDVTHLSEVAHTTQNSTTTTANTTANVTTTLAVSSTANMPTQGFIDIIDGTNGNETIAYLNIDSTHIYLASATTISHTSPVTVNQWYYALATGDQTNGIVNDGTESTPTAANVSTFYIYNAGNQIAQNPALSIFSSSPSTTTGYNDTQMSITSNNAGFATTVFPSNIAIGAVLQFWVLSVIPNGQSNQGNPQFGGIQMYYQSV